MGEGGSWGVRNRVVRRIERDCRKGEERIGRGEILGAIKRLKNGMAAGIPKEV